MLLIECRQMCSPFLSSGDKSLFNKWAHIKWCNLSYHHNGHNIIFKLGYINICYFNLSSQHNHHARKRISGCFNGRCFVRFTLLDKTSMFWWKRALQVQSNSVNHPSLTNNVPRIGKPILTNGVWFCWGLDQLLMLWTITTQQMCNINHCQHLPQATPLENVNYQVLQHAPSKDLLSPPSSNYRTPIWLWQLYRLICHKKQIQK